MCIDIEYILIVNVLIEKMSLFSQNCLPPATLRKQQVNCHHYSK